MDTGKLLHTEILCNGMMSARFARPLKRGQMIILALPGGPGLSSQYLDSFLFNLALRYSHFPPVNVGMLNLPNHGEAFVPRDKLPLFYPEVIELLQWALTDIRNRSSERSVLVAHSLGCRLALELVAGQVVKPQSIILLNPLFPDFDSKAPKANLSNLWKVLVMKHATGEFGGGEFQELASQMDWKHSEELFENVANIKEVLKRYEQSPTTVPVAIVEGQWDGFRVSQKCLYVLQALFANGGYIEIPKSAHFSAIDSADIVTEHICQFLKKLIPLPNPTLEKQTEIV